MASNSELRLSDLHVFVHRLNWVKAEECLLDNPEQADSFADDESWTKAKQNFFLPQDQILTTGEITPFHILCTRQDPPVQLIERYLSVSPNVASLADGNKRLPIHLACYVRQSRDVIQVIARSNSSALAAQDCIGWNVFHVLARFGGEEGVSELLLKSAGETVRKTALRLRDRKGRAPIELACEMKPRISQREFERLFQYSDVQQETRTVLLQQLCSNYHSCIVAALKAKPLRKSEVINQEPTKYCNEQRKVSIENSWLWRPIECLSLWSCLQKAFVLLGATDDTISVHPMLHSCLEVDKEIRTSMFQCLIATNPHFVRQIRADGKLPLHVAAELATSNIEWGDRLQTLVKLYPKAASLGDERGLIPIQLMSLTSLLWGHVVPVLTAWPEGFIRLQVPEVLYPLIFSRLIEDVNSVFVILSHNPNLIAGMSGRKK